MVAVVRESVALAGRAERALVARAFVSAVLGPGHPCCEDAVLLVSELFGNGQEHCKSFKNKTLAGGFLDDLRDAARDRRPFSPRTGLPAAETTEGEMITWFEHARSYAEAKWASLAPVSRRSVAEALVTVTIALTAKEEGAPEPGVLRRALFAWAFNPATREQDPPREVTIALGWAARASLPVSALDDPVTVRLALGACAKTLTACQRPRSPAGLGTASRSC